jgi:hypothetical protein
MNRMRLRLKDVFARALGDAVAAVDALRTVFVPPPGGPLRAGLPTAGGSA